MPEKEIQFRKKRELEEIISDSFEFLKQEAKPVSRLVIQYVLPFILLYSGLQVYVQINVIGNIDISDVQKIMDNYGPISKNIFLLSLFGVFVQSLLMGTFYSYLEIYIKKGKGNFSVSDISSGLFSNTLLALGANLVFFILVVVGVALCILPGIYFANSFSLLVIIFIFEKKGLSNALTRSWQLVHTQWLNTILINILGILIIYAAGFVFSIPLMITGATSTFSSLKESGTLEYPAYYWALMGLSTAVSSLLCIIPYTFLAFQYFNLNEGNTTVPPAVKQ